MSTITVNSTLFDLPADSPRTAISPSPNQLTFETRTQSLNLDTLHEMDCITGMRMLPADSFDLAIADPPYNASKGGNWQWDGSAKLPSFGGSWYKVMESWDSMPLVDYVGFTMSWLTELKRLVKPTGSIWIHGTYHNIGVINFALQLL